jgi:hypothetical protein
MTIYFLSPSIANPKSHDVRIGASHRVLKRTHYRYGPGQVFANDSWGVSLPYLDRNFFLAIYTEFKLGVVSSLDANFQPRFINGMAERPPPNMWSHLKHGSIV